MTLEEATHRTKHLNVESIVAMSDGTIFINSNIEERRKEAEQTHAMDYQVFDQALLHLIQHLNHVARSSDVMIGVTSLTALCESYARKLYGGLRHKSFGLKKPV